MPTAHLTLDYLCDKMGYCPHGLVISLSSTRNINYVTSLRCVGLLPSLRPRTSSLVWSFAMLPLQLEGREGRWSHHAGGQNLED
jgi:hypothetical protein